MEEGRREVGLCSPEDNVSPLGVSRDGRGDGGKAIGIDDGFLAPSKLGKTLLQLQMNIWWRGRVEEREREKARGGGR